jgi:hypothetical protein
VASDFIQRMQAWGRRLVTWKRGIWLLPIVAWEIFRRLVEDRFIGGLNKYLDNHSNTILAYVARIARFFLTHPATGTAIFAVAIILGLIVHAYIETRPSKEAKENPTSTETKGLDVHLKPSEGPSDKQFLAVTNRGKKQRFHATCRLLARRNDPNQLHERSYDLAWERDSVRAVTLAYGESCNLMIATAGVNHSIHLCEVGLQALSNGSIEKVEHSRWDEFDKKDKPEYDLEISIFGEGDQTPVTECFTLKCGGRLSALEMVGTQQEANARAAAWLHTHAKLYSGAELEPTSDGPSLGLEYSYSDRDKNADPSRPLTMINISNKDSAHNVRMLLMTIGSVQVQFSPDLIPFIEPLGKREVKAVLPDRPLFRHRFILPFEQDYKDTGEKELFEQKPYSLNIEYENAANTKLFETTIVLRFKRWHSELTVGETRRRLKKVI